jgi:hypothetical protein
MQGKYETLLKNLPPVKPLYRELTGEHPVLVYGAGDTGRKLAAFLKARGVEIAGFLDAKCKSGGGGGDFLSPRSRIGWQGMIRRSMK